MGVAARGPAHRPGARSVPDRPFLMGAPAPDEHAARPEAASRRHTMQKLDELDKASLRDDLPDFRPRDNVKVHVKVIEDNRSRTQVIQGYLVARPRHGRG